jgi:DHA1 family inner membrane transport protein
MRRPHRVRYQIATLSLARTLINIPYRMLYPFLPAFARGLGVDIETIALAITARSTLGVLGPVFGTVADRQGRKTAMLIGLATVTASLLLVWVWPSFPALVISLLAVGIGKIMYDTSAHAFAGDRVVYARRGVAIGVLEMSWSTAFFLGIPVVGWLIERSGWAAPFPWLALLIALSGGVVWWLIPSDRPAAGTTLPSPLAVMRIILTRRVAVAGMSVGLLISAANESVAIVFGLWLENAFALQIAALGIASTVIGIAELSGEGLVIGLADRLGKRRAVALGIAGSMITALALPLLGTSLTGSLIGLFLFYLAFEFTLVTSIALMTEIAPDVRATLMAGNVAFLSIGRAVGAPLGTALFAASILPNAATAAILNGIALILLLAFVQVDA